ncbi:MAG: hypothetical protein WBK43_01965 [Prolixibacteraceae bacterium]|jgi:hypothetical protein
MLAISIPHALTDFIDADNTDAPFNFKNQIWEIVKRGISKAVSDFLR